MPKRTAARRPARQSGLRKMDVIAFVPTRDPKRARSFYADALGLELVSEDPFALVFDAHGVVLRIANVSSTDFKPAPFTILGWDVPNVAKMVNELAQKGVQFERFPGMEQDEHGAWTSPSGARIAWFKDPDGNILSLTQH